MSLVLMMALVLGADPPHCLSPQEVLEAQGQVEAANTRAVEAALAREHLKSALLMPHRQVLGQGARPVGTVPGGGGPTVRLKIDGVWGAYVASEAVWSGAPHPPSSPRFVEDARGNVFMLELIPQPDPTHSPPPALSCACAPNSCPGLAECGSPCLACGETARILYGPLGKSRRFAGSVQVKYPQQALNLQYAKCPAPLRCPPFVNCPP